AAEHLTPAGAEFPHLDEPQTDGKQNAGKDQHIQQYAVPYKITGCLDNSSHLIHNLFHFIFFPFSPLRERPCPAGYRGTAWNLPCSPPPSFPFFSSSQMSRPFTGTGIPISGRRDALSRSAE